MRSIDREADLEQYFTSDDVASHCIEIAKAKIPNFDNSVIVEPSAGAGAFSDKIDGCLAFDLEPQKEGIERANFLWLPNDKFKKTNTLFDEADNHQLVFIGNPPFGRSATSLCLSFLQKCREMNADYIAFLLPAAYHNSDHIFYEYDLIHSEVINCDYYVLKEKKNKKVNTSFCIFKKANNEMPEYKFDYIDMNAYSRGSKGSTADNDKELKGEFLRICGFGVIGTIPKHAGYYASEMIFIENEYTHLLGKDKIIDFITNHDWADIIEKSTAAPSLSRSAVVKTLIREFGSFDKFNNDL